MRALIVLLSTLLGVAMLIAVELVPAAAQSTSPAAQVVLQLQTQMNVVALADLTPATDPEVAQGVPARYASKATFHDLSFDAGSAADQPSGAVEVFATARDRDARAVALGRTGVEVDLPIGTTGLLRLFANVAQQPQAANAYSAALSTVLLP